MCLEHINLTHGIELYNVNNLNLRTQTISKQRHSYCASFDCILKLILDRIIICIFYTSHLKFVTFHPTFKIKDELVCKLDFIHRALPESHWPCYVNRLLDLLLNTQMIKNKNPEMNINTFWILCYPFSHAHQAITI